MKFTEYCVQLFYVDFIHMNNIKVSDKKNRLMFNNVNGLAILFMCKIMYTANTYKYYLFVYQYLYFPKYTRNIKSIQQNFLLKILNKIIK